ncbi:hypothetical protein EV714DRAFT_271917 [Schizophyllum commune]
MSTNASEKIVTAVKSHLRRILAAPPTYPLLTPEASLLLCLQLGRYLRQQSVTGQVKEETRIVTELHELISDHADILHSDDLGRLLAELERTEILMNDTATAAKSFLICPPRMMMDAHRLTKRCKDLLAAGKARIRCRIAVIDEANRVPVQRVVTQAEQEVRDRHADVFLFGGDDNARQSLLDALEDMCLALDADFNDVRMAAGGQHVPSANDHVLDVVRQALRANKSHVVHIHLIDLQGGLNNGSVTVGSIMNLDLSSAMIHSYRVQAGCEVEDLDEA